MTLTCIVAVSENGVIGRAGDLPWHLPEDLKRFKRLTLGHTIIMGRKTWVSIGRVLPGRRSVVLTRTAGFAPEGATVVGSLDEALAFGEDEVFVIGGASLFAEALPRADCIHLTRVHARIEGDTFFPEEALVGFDLVEEEHHPADARHAHAFSFQTYRRRGS